MTARSSKRLATVLRNAGFVGLAERAEQDEFHDRLSPHDTPAMALDRELVAIISNDKFSERARMSAHNIRERHHDGEFDAPASEDADLKQKAH